MEDYLTSIWAWKILWCLSHSFWTSLRVILVLQLIFRGLADIRRFFILLETEYKVCYVARWTSVLCINICFLQVLSSSTLYDTIIFALFTYNSYLSDKYSSTRNSTFECAISMISMTSILYIINILQWIVLMKNSLSTKNSYFSEHFFASGSRSRDF